MYRKEKAPSQSQQLWLHNSMFTGESNKRPELKNFQREYYWLSPERNSKYSQQFLFLFWNEKHAKGEISLMKMDTIATFMTTVYISSKLKLLTDCRVLIYIENAIIHRYITFSPQHQTGLMCTFFLPQPPENQDSKLLLFIIFHHKDFLHK